MSKRGLSFIRYQCLGNTTESVIEAIETSVSSLRRRGLEVPDDAFIQVRRSGFGYAAELMLPERQREGREQCLPPRERAHSGVLPRLTFDDGSAKRKLG